MEWKIDKMLRLIHNKKHMRRKWLCMIWLGYIAWLAIAMKFSKKNATDTKKQVEKTWSFFGVFLENFVSIHKDIFKHFEQKIVTDENKQLVEEYKKKALDEVEKFKSEANRKIEELKDKWVKKKTEIEKEIIGIYEKRQQYFDKAKELWEEYADEALELWKEYLNEWRKRLDKAFEDIKKKLK